MHLASSHAASNDSLLCGPPFADKNFFVQDLPDTADSKEFRFQVIRRCVSRCVSYLLFVGVQIITVEQSFIVYSLKKDEKCAPRATRRSVPQ